MLYYHTQGRTMVLDARPYEMDLIVWDSPWGGVVIKAQMPYLIKSKGKRQHIAFRILKGKVVPYVFRLPALGVPIDSEYDAHHHRHMLLFQKGRRHYFAYSDDGWISYTKRKVYSTHEPLRFAGPRTLVTPINSMARRRNIPHTIQPVYLDGQVGKPFLLHEKIEDKYSHRLSVNFDGRHQFVLNTEADHTGQLMLTMHHNKFTGMHYTTHMQWAYPFDPFDSYGVQHDNAWYVISMGTGGERVLRIYRDCGIDEHFLR